LVPPAGLRRIFFSISLSSGSRFAPGGRSASRPASLATFSRFGRLISVRAIICTFCSTLGCTVMPCMSGLRMLWVST
jgi:hypothetical protein